MRSEAAWRAVLEICWRGLAKPELGIVDGGKGFKTALGRLWDDIQCCWVHGERTRSPSSRALHDQIKADFNDMVHAKTDGEVLRSSPSERSCQPVATGLEDAGERLVTFLRYPPDQWRSLRTTNIGRASA